MTTIIGAGCTCLISSRGGGGWLFVVRISTPSNFTFHFINRVTGLVIEGVTAFLQRHSTEVQHMSLGMSMSQCGQSPPGACPARSSSGQRLGYFLNTQAVDDDGRGRKISQFLSVFGPLEEEELISLGKKSEKLQLRDLYIFRGG